MMKTSVSSYSFSQYLNDSRMQLVDCISKAKELGFDAIEYTDANGILGSRDDFDYAMNTARQLREESERVGFPIISYDFSSNLIKDYPAKSVAEIAHVKQQIDLAECMGVNIVRHDASFGNPGMDFSDDALFDEYLPTLAEACREITEYAQSKGIRTTVENHGFFCQDSNRVEKLMLAVNHPNFGWLMDFGNFMCADEDSKTACERAAQYAFHAHAKDFHYKKTTDVDPGEGFFKTRGGNYLRGSILGHGVVPVKDCLAALKQANYDGYVSLEFEGMEDSLKAIRIGHDNLVRFISEL